MSVADRLKKIKREIKETSMGCGRREFPVLVAVSKRQRPERILEGVNAGIVDFGENYVQEALTKMDQMEGRGIRWHLIGPLQKNKIRRAVGRFQLIHTISDFDTAQAIERVCGELSCGQDFLIQINFANESSKSGCPEQDACIFLDRLYELKRACCRGIMVMPPLAHEASESKSFFSMARNWLEKNRERVPEPHSLSEISMGTSQDYLEAVKEGATILRIGEALLGPREE